MVISERTVRAEAFEVDAELRPPLDEVLAAYPGGIFAIPNLNERRRVESAFAAEANRGVAAEQTCSTEDVLIPADDLSPAVPIRVYRPQGYQVGTPAVFYIHGGGMIMCDLDSEHSIAMNLCQELDVLVVATSYRKAPESPYPAAVEDCYKSYLWMFANVERLGFDPGRTVIFGGSAGGNLALAVGLVARDRQGPRASLIMAPYPMLDPSNESPSSYEVQNVGSWDRATNVEAWGMYLAGQEADGLASPLRADDLSALPGVFLDVGTVDLFRDECLAMVTRLLQARVPTEFHLYPGAYHGSEVWAPAAGISQQMWDARKRALRRCFER